MDEETFVFGSFRLIPAQRMLLEDEKPLRLGSRALDILVTLVESAGETIRKDLLIARTWPDTVVDEGALRVHVAALRKVLGDGRAGKRYIVNNPGRGLTLRCASGARTASCASRSSAWARARRISRFAATTNSKTASSRFFCRPGRMDRSLGACSPASRLCCRFASRRAWARRRCK